MDIDTASGLEILRSEADVGGWIRRHRHARKMTQAALASRSGVTATHISRIESGVTAIRPATVLTLAAALDLDLFGGRRGLDAMPARSDSEPRSGRDSSWVRRSIKDAF